MASHKEFKENLERKGLRHVRLAPYHLASNGLAERYVQTFKTSLKKSGEVDAQQQLSQFLFCYHTTPHSTTGVPPAQLLMGHRLQTRLDSMRPSVASRVTRAQARQKAGHDKPSQDRQFTLGDSVFVWNFAASPTWVARSITAEPPSFDVELGDGRVVKRHIDHVRTRADAPPEDNPASVDIEDIPLPSTAAPTEPVDTPSPSAPPGPHCTGQLVLVYLQTVTLHNRTCSLLQRKECSNLCM